MTTVTRLPNGLAIVTDTRRDVETVSLGVFVQAGSRHEQPHEHGLAHFLEHMAFKGTRRRTAFQTVADIEARGGDINAETSPEATSYTVRMLADDWTIGLDVLLDLITAPRFHHADIAVEQEVVLQEIAGALDLPDDRLVDGLGMAAFGDHPLGRPILGTPESVLGLTDDALNAFRGRTYAPGAIIVSAAGNVDHDALVREVERLEPDLPAPSAQDVQAATFVAGNFAEERGTYDTHLAIAWPAPAFGAPDAIAHACAVQMLGGGMTSRLFQSIREEAGLAYAVDAYQMVFNDGGLGIVQTATASDKVEALARRLSDEMLRFADTMTQNELDLVKRQFRASLAMGEESLPSLAGRHARQIAGLGKIKPRSDLEAEVEAVSLADIRALWQATMQHGRIAKAAVGHRNALDLWMDWPLLGRGSSH